MPRQESRMCILTRALCVSIATVALLTINPTRSVAATAQQSVRLYTLDGGSLDFDDISSFSDTGDYDGKSGHFAVPCFLIWHPKGTLLWDTGLDAGFARRVGEGHGIRVEVGPSLETQLSQIGLTPAKITYLAFSHLHVDHI